MTSRPHRSGPGLNVVVSGAGGLIGSALVPRLGLEGHQVTRLVRRDAGRGEISWDPARRVLDPASLEGAEAVVHLSGENLAARWTGARKARIRASRVDSTRFLSETLARLRRPPRVMIAVSAIGIYGDRGDELMTEESPPGDAGRDFLVSLTQEWEGAAEPARSKGIRVVHPRLGVVLSPAGGALGKMLLPFRLGLGGRLGSGEQWLSWIAIDDAVEALVFALIEARLEGPLNLTSPEPVTNRDFTRTLARILNRPAALAVPAAALELAFGEMARTTILSSARVRPAKLLRAGYSFGYPDLEGALRHVLRRERR